MMTAAPSTGEKHLMRIDVMRGIAILMVVGYHFHLAVKGEFTSQPELLAGWVSWVLYPLHFGNAGVSLFFVISGYVIHRSFSRDPNFTWAKYVSRRFWRIYPAYIVVLVALSVRNGLLGTRGFALHAGMIHNMTAIDFFGINASFWSIAVEVQLYALYPIAHLAYKPGRAGRMLLFGILASTVWRIWAATQVGWLTGETAHIWMNPIALWPDWLLGAYLSERHAADQRVFRRPTWWIILGVALLLMAEACPPLLSIQFSILSLVFAVVLDQYLRGSSKLGLLSRAMIWVGVCSYSLYLIHQPFMGGFAHRLARLGIDHPLLQIVIGLPIYTFIALLVSWILYLTIERGGIWFGNWLYNRRRKPKPSPIV